MDVTVLPSSTKVSIVLQQPCIAYVTADFCNFLDAHSPCSCVNLSVMSVLSRASTFGHSASLLCPEA